MTTIRAVFLAICLLMACLINVHGQFTPGHPIYTEKPDDPQAAYFTAGDNTDVSLSLQTAIDQLKKDRNFGILFIPQGVYTISKTIYVPASIRLIGYGKNRPLIVLKKGSPGFPRLPNMHPISCPGYWAPIRITYA